MESAGGVKSLAKATTRKKTKSSGRKAASGKRSASTRKATSSRTGTAAGKSKKAKAKARKTSSKKKSAKKTTRKAAKKTAARRTKPARKATGKKTARKTTGRKTTRKKASKKKSVSKKKAVAKKKAATKAKPVKQAAKKTKSKAPAKTAQKETAKKTSSKAKSAAAAAATAEVSLPSVEDALAQLPYHEGQFVVHPKYGLGKVDRVTERKLSTRTVPCLEISFSYQEMRLTIPVDQVGRSGLRRPISRKQIDEVFKALKGRATFDAKRRSAKRVVDYRKRLNQGDPISLAEAIRDLGRLSLKKSLSYEERKILSTALRILSREVALARGREPDDVREEIEKIVYR